MGEQGENVPTPAEFYEERIKPMAEELRQACMKAGLPFFFAVQIDTDIIQTSGWTPEWCDEGMKVAGIILRSERVATDVVPIIVRMHGEGEGAGEGGASH